MKKRALLTACALAIYALLLAVLLLAESRAGDGGIRTLGDALWFSLVTMTTVGYGDLYPVTALGRAVGLVFLVVSTGLLAAALSFAAALIMGGIFPALRLRLWRRRGFYIFNNAGEEALCLARRLSLEEPGGVYVFLAPGGRGPRLPKGRFVLFSGSLEELLGIGKNIAGVFLLGGGPEAPDIPPPGSGPVYVESPSQRSYPREDIAVFSRYENAARLYWQRHPLAPGEACIALLGMGEYGQCLLEQGLLVNVFQPRRHVEYHVFGDDGRFLLEHTGLGPALSLNAPSTERDALFLHADPWNADPELLARADRIIICTDSDEEDLALADTLFRRYPTRAAVHLRLLRPGACAAAPAVPFGSCQELFTPQLVLRRELNALAVAMNGLYRARVPGAPDWEGLSPFHRRSSLAAADHVLTKLRLLLPDEDITAVTGETCRRAYAAYKSSLPQNAGLYREIEHERWRRFLYVNNWRSAPRRDDTQRLHPLLCPYEELSHQEQCKDDDAWELLQFIR